jgi:hypothetical protein
VKPPIARVGRGRALRLRRTGGPAWPKRWAVALSLAGCLYLAWPYVDLWGLSQAVADPDPAALASRIDLKAVRSEIRQKLNKDSPSAIGRFSDSFIQWLDHGIQRLGTGALDELVTLDWVRERLSDGAAPGQGFLPRVVYAFFDSPRGFAVSLSTGRQAPVHFRMTLQGSQWRVTALYY